MPISANAVTLAQYALMSNDPIVRAVTFSLIENGNVMQDIPFITKKSLVANGVRWEGNLPSVNWVNINEEGATTSGTPTPFQEQAFILRNYIDVDKYLVEDENQIVDPRGAQTSAYLKAQTYDFNDKFINNSAVANAKSIVGLRARIDNGSQYGVRSENKINAGAVDLTAAMTAATFAAFTEYVDQLLWSVDSPEGDNVVLYLNDLLKRRWERGLRQFAGQGGFSQAQDQFGRTISTYKNAVIRDVGYKADQTTRIITATETAAGADGASTHTSLYAARLDTEHLFGWEFEPLKAKDLGLLENGAVYRTLIDWAGGLYNNHTRSMARLYGVKLS
jgi:hypothetical protein